MKLVPVEIKAEGWLGYTGPLGGFQFKDGKSVEPIPLRIALRIGATMEAYDISVDPPLRLHPSTYAVDFRVSHVESRIEALPTDAQVKNPPLPEVEPETTQDQTPKISLEPTKIVMGDGSVKVVYSRAQLEAIADRSGISGLREIGDPLGVKGRSVGELIERIIEKQ
jgi:hypothetical protein